MWHLAEFLSIQYWSKKLREVRLMMWKMIQSISFVLCWIAPFTFVFFLLSAIKETIKEGPNDVAFGFGAAISLLIIVAACVLTPV